MARDIHVKGLSELNAALDQLPVRLKANVLRGALRAGANEIAQAAKDGVPVRTGALRDSIRVGTKVEGDAVKSSVKAGGKNRKRGTGVWYAHLIEFTGAAAHVIRAKRTKFLAIGGGFYRLVWHPGFRPRPFMRPAMDTRAGAAVVAVAEYMKRRLATKHGIATGHITVEGDE